MLARTVAQRSKLLAVAVLLPLIVACSDNNSTGPDSNPLVGTWQVTSFQALGVDAIDLGLSMTITFSAGKTYTAVITDDSGDSCDGATSCTETGSYSSTSTQVTMDPGTEDEVTFQYSIHGTTLTFTGSTEGIPVTMILERKS